MFVSLKVSSTAAYANALVLELRTAGLEVWICSDLKAGDAYREEIVVNATTARSFVCLIDKAWAESGECRFEFNTAMRTFLTKGKPIMLPVLMDPALTFDKYPLLTGLMANTNALIVNLHAKETAKQILKSLKVAGIAPSSGERVTRTDHVNEDSHTMSTDELLKKHPSEWTDAEVGNWLDSLNMVSQRPRFAESLVDGQILVTLDEQLLKDGLGYNPIQAQRMGREIKELMKRYKPSKDGTKKSAKGAKIARDYKSKVGFVSGKWKGFYQYGAGNQDDTEMDVTMIAGTIAGYGTDVVGDFVLQGYYDDLTREISWNKQYVGKHLVKYKGVLVESDQKKIIKGNWQIPDSWGGAFEFTYHGDK